MTSKKKQHYVPKFYLKNFSADSSRVMINLFNISSERYIIDAPIKNQAYSDYFYDKEAIIENGLQDIETVASDLIRNSIRNKYLPIFGSGEHFNLLTFVILQSSRTMYQAELADEMLDKMIKSILKDDPRINGNLESIKVGHKSPAAYILGITTKILPITMDLKYKMVINNTQIPFITSDNPVVKYNQFMMTKKMTPGGMTGLGVKGLEIFFPLNPKTLLVFYDDGVYRVGNKRDTVITINNQDDIDNLNILQMINANHNIYFNDECTKNYIKTIYEKGKRFLRNHKANLNEFRSAHEHDSKLVMISEENANFKFRISFIKEIKRAKSFDLGNNVVYLRNPSLTQAVRGRHDYKE